MSSSAIRSVVVVAFVLGASCSDSTTGPVPECTGSVTVQVSAGTTPRFTWVPACRLFFVLVEPAQAGNDLWSIIADSANIIAPPVTYGTVPSGATQLQAPTPLVTGTAYAAYLYRWTGPGAQDGVLVGSQTFTP